MEFVRVAAFIIISYVVIRATHKNMTKSHTVQLHSNDYDLFSKECTNASGAELLRKNRALVYPPSSTVLLIFGIGTPLQLDRESIIVGAFTKLIYALPEKSSELTKPVAERGREQGRERSPLPSRWYLYQKLASLLEFYGFGEGRSCVLRAICEAASAPFDHRQGVLQRLLQTFLSPSSTREVHEENLDREYAAAERFGRHVGENCHALYYKCRSSFLDVFSRVRTLSTRTSAPR